MKLAGWCNLASLLVLGLASCDLPAPEQTSTPILAFASPTFVPVISPSPAPSLTPTQPPTAMTTPVPIASETATAQATTSLLLIEQLYSPWDQVTALGWTPDGLYLAVAAGEHIHVYAADNFTEQAILAVGVWTSQLTFDPACFSVEFIDCLALAARDGTLQFWSVSKAQRLASWMAHRKSATSLSFSRDGSILATSGNDALVRLWDLTAYHATGLAAIPQRAEMIGGAFAVPAVRFSPDGKLVASIDNQSVRLRDSDNQRLVRTLRTGGSLFNILFSPDGRWLATGELDNIVRLWDVTNGDPGLVLATQDVPGRGVRPFVWSLAFSSDGHLLAAGSSDGFIRLWSLNDGLLVDEWLAHSRAVTALEFKNNDRILASGGLDAALRLWSVKDK